MTVGLLPNASKKASGNDTASKGCSNSSDTASSISTAFNVVFRGFCYVYVNNTAIGGVNWSYEIRANTPLCKLWRLCAGYL